MSYPIGLPGHFNLAMVDKPGDGVATTLMIYGITIAIIVLLLLLIPIINRIFDHLSQSVEAWGNKKLKVIRMKGMELAIPKGVRHSLLGLVINLRFVIVYGLLLMCGILVFNLFPKTRVILVSIGEQIVEYLKMGWNAFVDFLPDLLALIFISILTHFSMRLLKFLSEGIKKRQIKISGVHPELIDPTYQLLRFLLVAFAVVAAFP